MTDLLTALDPHLTACLHFPHGKDGPPRIAVAVSGGADSMAMAHILGAWRAKIKADFIIDVLSVDHGLRKNAAKEAQLVHDAFAPREGYNFDSLTVRWDEGVPESGLMKAARDKRYALMQQYCETHAIEQLYTGHHMDDQAETFLMRLTRGSGLDGLAAMPMIQPIYGGKLYVMRPLLHVTHEQLTTYCQAAHLPWAGDPTNQDARFTRSRMRQSMAVLQEEGLTAQSLSRTAQRLARAAAALEHVTDDAIAHARTQHSTDKCSYDWQILQRYPEDIILRVLLRAYDELRPERYYRPRLERLEDILSDLLNDKTYKARILGGLDIRLHEDALILSREN